MGAPLGAADLFFFSFTSQGGELLPLIDPLLQPESYHRVALVASRRVRLQI